MHRKVTTRVFCVLSENDAQAAARAEAFANRQAAFAFQERRPQVQQGLGGMGNGIRQPGKSGLTFDHILSRLQGELQKSKEAGGELYNLTGALNEVHDSLGGTLVCLLFSRILHFT